MERLLGAKMPVGVQAWDGSCAGPLDGPCVVLRSSRALRHVLWQPGELGLARAYVTGDLDVDGDLAEGPRPPVAEARLSGRLHTRRRDRAAIAHHYDLSNSATSSVCARGCGWGSLVIHAAMHFGVHATGITLSAQQRDHVLARAKGLNVDVRLQDYRELTGEPYDAVASIEMGERPSARRSTTWRRRVSRSATSRRCGRTTS